VTLIKTLDSINSPTAAQLDAAYADGVRAWNGYLYWPKNWQKANFDLIRAHGMQCIAYATGWDDAATCKALATLWGVKGCLDIESGTRPNGPWVAQWLATSGFGYYASRSGYPVDAAPFHIMAEYVANDPGLSWPPGVAVPGGTPHGWQWHGSIGKYGANVDLCWFDAEVFGGTSPAVDNSDVAWLLYKISGDTSGSEYVFTGSAVVPMVSPTEIATLVENGNLKDNTPGNVSAAQHASYLKVGSPGTVVNTGGTTPPASGVLSGTITISAPK
jgi:hypothetical protein